MRLLCFFIIAFLKINGASINAAEAPIVRLPNTFETAARNAVLFDYKTRTILFSKDGDQPMTPSSMSKLMTTYIAFQRIKEGLLKLDSEIKISRDAWKIGGSRMFLDIGSQVKVEDLLRGVIVQSGNDASVALAEGIAGSESIFVNYMNEAAQKLGLENSHFENATGWPDPNHKMSAVDLARLSYFLIKDFPDYYHYFAEKSFTYNKISQSNRNTLLGVSGVDGLKTGHTEEGGYGIVVSAIRNGRRLIAVVNGLKNEKERIEEVEKLLTYGANNFRHYIIAKKDDSLGSLPIWGGKDLFVDAVAYEDIEILVPRNEDPTRLTREVEYDEPILAPVTKGSVIGTLNIKNGDLILRSVPMYARTDIEEAGLVRKFWYNCKSLLGFKMHKIK